MYTIHSGDRTRITRFEDRRLNHSATSSNYDDDNTVVLVIRLLGAVPACFSALSLLLNASRQTPTQSCELSARNSECSLRD